MSTFILLFMDEKLKQMVMMIKGTKKKRRGKEKEKKRKTKTKNRKKKKSLRHFLHS